MEIDNKFGLQTFTENDLNKLYFLPSNLLKLLKYHRGFNDIDDISNSSRYYLYTGRGTSCESFHIGHLLGLRLVLELQKKLKNEIFFMISDDEKIFRDKIDQLTMQKNVSNTIKQLNNMGFNEKNTHFHVNSDGINKQYYTIMIKLMTLLNVETLNNIFGKKSNVGELFYVAYQLMPCFIDQNKQCIIVAGEDQDPFFRLARDIAHKLNCKPPIVIYTINFPGLDGSDKMSTSLPETIPIFISDTEDIIKNKVFKIKKVGVGTLDELFEKGSDLSNDVPFKLIEFLENNILIINLIKKAYTSGLYECDSDELNKLKEIQEIPRNGIITKNNKTMITTFGLRSYLVYLIKKELNI